MSLAKVQICTVTGSPQDLATLDALFSTQMLTSSAWQSVTVEPTIPECRKFAIHFDHRYDISIDIWIDIWNACLGLIVYKQHWNELDAELPCHFTYRASLGSPAHRGTDDNRAGVAIDARILEALRQADLADVS